MINTTSDMITVKTLSQRNKNHNNDNLHEYQTGAIKVVDILLSEKFCFLYCFCMEKNLDYYLSSIHLLCHYSIVTQYCRTRV